MRGEFNNMAIIDKPRVAIVMQVCFFGIDGIEMSKFMPEKPAEMFVTSIGQKILVDKDCMQEALEEWLKHCVYPHGDISARNQLNQKDFCRYGTLDDALTFLFTALKYPDSILT